MIREAVLDDVDGLVALLSAEYIQSEIKEHIPLCIRSVATEIKNLINDEQAVLYVYEKAGIIVGAIAFRIHCCWFNVRHKAAVEMFWYVYPQHRGHGIRLLKAAVLDVKCRGVATFEMGASHYQTKTMLSRLGMKPTTDKFMGTFQQWSTVLSPPL